jgi:hypothetical protein
LRRLSQLHEEYGDKGLHIIGAFTQFQPLETIEKHIKDFGIQFPVAMDGFWATELMAPLLCHIFVIGVDGTLIHVSINDWEKAALQELKKVKYPGLGMQEVDEVLEPAAKAFGEKRFLDAYRLATKVAEGDHDFDVLDQADHIVDRVRDRMSLLDGRARLAEATGDYELAMACLTELEARFKDVDEFLDPAERIKELREREDFEAEIKARHEFMGLRIDVIRTVDGAATVRERFRLVTEACIRLRRFASSHEKLMVAAIAQDMLAGYEAWASELESEIKSE